MKIRTRHRLAAHTATVTATGWLLVALHQADRRASTTLWHTSLRIPHREAQKLFRSLSFQRAQLTHPESGLKVTSKLCTNVSSLFLHSPCACLETQPPPKGSKGVFLYKTKLQRRKHACHNGLDPSCLLCHRAHPFAHPRLLHLLLMDPRT